MALLTQIFSPISACLAPSRPISLASVANGAKPSRTVGVIGLRKIWRAWTWTVLCTTVSRDLFTKNRDRTTSHYNQIDPHMLAITTHASEGMCACEASNITRGDVSNWVETDRMPTRRLQASSSVAKQTKTFTYFWLSSRSSKKIMLGKTIQLILPPFNYITHRTKSYEVNEVSYPNATRAPSAHEWDPKAIAANCATQLEGLAVRPWGRYS